MKSDIECLMCLMKQAFNTMRLVTDDRILQREIMNRTAQWIRKADLNDTPASISGVVYQIVSEVTGNPDPYADVKKETNAQALALLPRLESLLIESPDPLDTALHLAVAGNIIDLGIGHHFDLEKDLSKTLETSFAVNHSEDFRKELQPGHRLLYLGDNSGEIVFDRFLVEQILKNGMDVTYSVKSFPIINDVTRRDAEDTGMADLVPILETGSGDIGVNFHKSSAEFLKAFQKADIILGKGHGNFESCSDRPENLYFLLKAKCPVVARELGVNTGDIVFKHYPKR